MKKGFTLLELLAVIVVIAIITLIAIPVIANVIDKAKQGSAIDSAYGYIDAIEKNIALGQMDNTKGLLIPENNELNMQNEDDAEILNKMTVKGEKPDYAEITFENNKVKKVGFCINNYNIVYENKVASLSNVPYCDWARVKSVELASFDSKPIETNEPMSNSRIAANSVEGITEYSLKLISGDKFAINSIVTTVDNETTIPDYSSTNSTVATVDANGIITAGAAGEAVIKIKAGIRFIKIKLTVVEGFLLDELANKNFGTTGEFSETIVHNSTTKYTTHIYNFEGSQNWTTENAPNGGVFGNSDDIGANGKYAQNMVIVRINGDLTINSGVTVRPYYSIYGGPKGFMIYVTGNIINNGTIDNSHGAYAKGEDVYLWENATYDSEENRYEYVPAVGANGADPVTNTSNHNNYSGTAGKSGSTKAKRATGGGGSGGIQHSTSGRGGKGTSYSGGSGGGAGASWSGHSYGNPGSDEGGAGGSFVSTMTSPEGGGAGNPGGKTDGPNGTGGLLIIFADSFTNTGVINAKGYPGGFRTGGDSSVAGGGGSGGGSINIFYKGTYTNTGTMSVASSATTRGGAGGAGTITIGSIATGTFVQN